MYYKVKAFGEYSKNCQKSAADSSLIKVPYENCQSFSIVLLEFLHSKGNDVSNAINIIS